MKINAQRLMERIQHLMQFGTTAEGGVTRYALSPEEKAATTMVARWMEEAGLQVRYDAAGNLYGRLPGRQQGPAVLTGSHLDSVPNGGHYDGPAGVLCALEAVQALREAGFVPEYPVEVVSFQGEEGSRFPSGLLGSSLVAGTFHEDLDRLIDRNGVSLRQAMVAYGADPDRLHEVKAVPGSYRYYVELHIEQSGLLESRGLSCGVVTGIAGLQQMRGVIVGRAEHAGACPMELRKDPLPAAAEVILAVERAARESDPATRATVGYVKPFPGATNVIPARVEMTFDVRDLDRTRRDACVDRVRSEFNAILERRGLTGETTLQHEAPPTICDRTIMAATESAAAEAGIPVMRLPSGAVHDASNIARLCPVGMIFLRSKDGLSHTPREYTSPEDLGDGAQLLLGTLQRLSG